MQVRRRAEPKRADSRGFTLVEVVISSSILAVVIAGLMAGFVSALRVHRHATRHYHATVLARNRLMRARSIYYTGLRYLAQSKMRINELGDRDERGNFIRSTTVETNVPSAPFCTRVTCRVWYIMEGHTSSSPVMMSTLVAEE